MSDLNYFCNLSKKIRFSWFSYCNENESFRTLINKSQIHHTRLIHMGIFYNSGTAEPLGHWRRHWDLSLLFLAYRLTLFRSRRGADYTHLICVPPQFFVRSPVPAFVQYWLSTTEYVYCIRLWKKDSYTAASCSCRIFKIVRQTTRSSS